MAEPFIVEKVMALSAAEFAATLLHLTNSPFVGGAAVIPLATGRVEIRCSEAQGRRLGGLLTLPQAIVRLIFYDVDEAARAGFLLRFDRAFQRGGG